MGYRQTAAASTGHLAPTSVGASISRSGAHDAGERAHSKPRCWFCSTARPRPARHMRDSTPAAVADRRPYLKARTAGNSGPGGSPRRTMRWRCRRPVDAGGGRGAVGRLSRRGEEAKAAIALGCNCLTRSRNQSRQQTAPEAKRRGAFSRQRFIGTRRNARHHRPEPMPRSHIGCRWHPTRTVEGEEAGSDRQEAAIQARVQGIEADAAVAGPARPATSSGRGLGTGLTT